MSSILDRLRTVPARKIADRLRTAGVAGAGGAGFPSYVKWADPDDLRYLFVNHQESEPSFYADKWLGRERSEELAALFEYLLETCFDAVFVVAKERDRTAWLGPLEAATGAKLRGPDDLPLEPDDESGVTIAYTPDVYTYSEERTLLQVTAGIEIGTDIPTDHGYLVHNTETLHNVYRALAESTPVTRKYVHVDGDTDWHRCLDVPVGTRASDLLEAARTDLDDLDDVVLADGGPGWCHEITESPGDFGVRKRTNGLFVIDRGTAGANVDDDGRIDVLGEYDRTGRTHEVEPLPLEPSAVRIPLSTNDAHAVAPSEPTVEPGDRVAVGDLVAAPKPDALSIPQHASIDGEVTAIEDGQIVVERR